MAFLGLIPDAKGVSLQMSEDDVKREATGRALALLGSTIGLIGGVMILSANPAAKQQATGAWAALPPNIRDNKPALIVGIGVAAALLIAYRVKTLRKANSNRYGA